MDPRRRATGRVLAVAAMVVMLPTLVLTLTRLSGSTAGLALRVEAVTPFGIVLYALAAILGLGWLATRADGLRAPGAVVGAAVVGLVVHLCWFGPMLVDSAPAPAADAPVVTVMTANLLFGGADTAAVVSEVAQAGVDVLVLEEVTQEAVDGLDDAGATDLLPYVAGGARPDPRDRTGGTMVLSDLPLDEITDLPTRFDGFSIEVGSGEDSFTLFAVHPAPPTQGDQWRADFAALTQAARTEHPDVVMGDLNATLDHKPLRTLLDTGLRDAAEMTGSGFQPTWPSNGLGTAHLPPFAQIDHVLVGGEWTALSSRTVVVPRSDHRAVVAEVARR